MAMREFLVYPDISGEDSEVQSNSRSFRPPLGGGDTNTSSRIDLIPVQNSSYGSTAHAGNRHLNGPPKLHIISVLDKEFYVTRIQGTPRFNPVPAGKKPSKKRSSKVSKHRREAFDSTDRGDETTSYEDDRIAPEKSVIFDRSQENCGLIYPKSSPRKVPAPRILSRFNPRHWAERPALKSQLPSVIHRSDGNNVTQPENGANTMQGQLTQFSDLSSYH